MAQATRYPNQIVNDADLLWRELGVIGADEMLDHVRSDNEALSALRLALEHDAAGDRGLVCQLDGCK